MPMISSPQPISSQRGFYSSGAGAGAPTNTVPCTISPDGSHGFPTLLTAVQGTWTGGTKPYTFTYSWQTGTTVLGTGTTYTTQSSDQGNTIVLVETCTDSASHSASQQSSDSVQVEYSAPVYTGTPPVVTVSGFGTGAVLTCDAGASFAGADITLSYQWQSSGSAVGTDSQTYTTQAGDSGNQISCAVTATNPGGSVGPEASSAWTLLVDPTFSSLVTPAAGNISGIQLNFIASGASGASFTVNFYDQSTGNSPTSDSPLSVPWGNSQAAQTLNTNTGDTYYGDMQSIGDGTTTISSNVVSSLPATVVSL